MRQHSRGSTAVSAPLASHSLGEVLVASLVVAAVLVGVVAVVAQPVLGVGLAAVALALRTGRAVPVARNAHARLFAKRRRPVAE